MLLRCTEPVALVYVIRVRKWKANSVSGLLNWNASYQVSMSSTVGDPSQSWAIHSCCRIADQFDSTLAKLQSAENQIEELKSQLDDALGAEEILVQLTEKNLALADVSRGLIRLWYTNLVRYRKTRTSG
jgi:hypothetical protein